MSSLLRVNEIRTTSDVLRRGIESYAIICDEKSDGNHAGTFTSGSWLGRDLNTTITDPDNIVSVSSNRFTLQAGNYIVHVSAPAIEVNRHQIRLNDVTNSTVKEYGSNEYSNNANGYATTRSMLETRLIVTASTTYEIEHRCHTTRNSFGFGIDTGFGGVNIYTIVKIFKEA
tara:strand:- start:257 stop:772 length:516 start_codon:yes stop_codon:yes gene_type:complete